MKWHLGALLFGVAVGAVGGLLMGRKATGKGGKFGITGSMNAPFQSALDRG